MTPDPTKRGTAAARSTDLPRHRLERLFEPRSVCIVGASERPGSLGLAAVRNLLDGGFRGRLDLVNPRHRKVLGRNCHPHVAGLKEPADVAVLAIPVQSAPDVLDQLAALGTGHAVLLGRLELAPEQRDRLRERVAATGMRLVGPGSLGLARPGAGLNLTVAKPAIKPGSLAIVSQSSAVCAALLDFAEGSGIGVSTVAAVGSGIDVDVAEILDYLSYDATTRSIAVYLDGVRDGRRLLSTLRAAARGKPIVILKSGQNDVGARARLTHTDVLTSDHETFRSALRRCGAVSVDSFGELFSAVEWLDNGRKVRGDRLAIVTNGGGLGALAAGACRRHAVNLATLGGPTIDALAAHLPSSWSGGNPVNVLPDAPPQRIAAAVKTVAADPGADAVLAIFCATRAADSATIAQALLENPTSLPTMYGFVGEADARHGWEALNRKGHSVFKTPEEAVRAFSVVVEYQRSQRNLLQAPPMRRATLAFDDAAIDAAIEAAIAGGQQVLDEVRSKKLLAACGIPVPETLVAKTVEEATRLADRVGYPVVLKVISPDIAHKSDVGGVRLDIRDKLELRGAATAIQQRLRSSPGSPRFEGFALQPMVRRGAGAFELLVGVSRDPAFGPVITFGAGGIAVELIADTATALPPLNSLLAHDLISRTKVSQLLAGYRHLPAANRDAIADALVSLSALVCRFPAIAGMDINPLLASADGVLALDARIVLDPANPQRDSRYSHLAIHPYPAEVEKVVALKRPPAPPDADPPPPRPRVLLRPIQPDDARVEVEFFDRLSPETRQWRFLHPIKSLTPEMVARFTQIDYDRDMALVALPVAEDGSVAERIVAVARYLREVDDSRCEFAVVVEDQWQGRGLAGAIMGHLIDHARTVGLRTMVGYIHGQNARMLRFVRRLGFEIGDAPDEPGLRQATLALQPAAAEGSAASGAVR